MILKEVTLRNIRSYVDETVVFPRGSILLAGDIGSGKSSLLFAVEFALFGASRSDLPVELLLRKGATSASVSLVFELPGKDVTITRYIKKEKDTIKQMAGEVIVNNVTKELTPVEMKAEVLALLGYPEDLLTKNKNYIFRYTVYTPQEEMKFILQDDPEIRLQVLRKVFNVDKYSTIRENTLLYLKSLRVAQAGLKAKTEPLEQYRQKFRENHEEKELLSRAGEEAEKDARQLKEHLQAQQEKVLVLEQKYQQVHQVTQRLSALKALLKDNELRKEQLTLKQEQITPALAEIKLPEEIVAKTITAEIQLLEKTKQEHLQKKVSLNEKIMFCQKQISQLRSEVEGFQTEIQHLEEKQKTYGLLSQVVAGKTSLVERKRQVEDLFEKTQALITKNQTLLAQSREMQERVAHLDTCPTCLQQVAVDHKHRITEQEAHKIRQAELILGELQKRRATVWLQREEVLREIDALLQKENTLAKLAGELAQLVRKQEVLDKKREELRSYAQENNRRSQELQELETVNNTDALSRSISEKQQQLQLLLRQEYLLKQQSELQQLAEECSRKSIQYQQEIVQLEQMVATAESILPLLEKEKTMMSELLGKERDASVRVAQLTTKRDFVTRQLDELTEQVVSLTREQERLIRLREIHHWLEEFFINLTYTIEKHVMVRAHRLFNQCFQEWFAMLIDDEQTSGRIDDLFTPVIEQNGHEISFAHLSGGERTSAALAYRLALNRVISDVVHTIQTKDLLVLDEPTDGFSAEQLDKMRDVLERLGLQQTILVSHESKIESFVEKVIRIQKEGHVSSVVQ
ncbi:SMC family ATPase [Candidatus Woesearchaeota archaeon]|nr:SMC family ATPase [Candidatus Woesearchaeota archaeon]